MLLTFLLSDKTAFTNSHNTYMIYFEWNILGHNDKKNSKISTKQSIKHIFKNDTLQCMYSAEFNENISGTYVSYLEVHYLFQKP